LTVDGVGEWATASIGFGQGNKIKMLKEMSYPNSVGLLYSAFTQFLGFKVNSGEYKMMGLAPYGEPIYYDLILEKLITLSDDGSIKINQEYFVNAYIEYNNQLTFTTETSLLVAVVLQESNPLTVSVKMMSPVAPGVGTITGFKSF
jgi:predicted NodU family carbamoyl transferase